jgi:hypothetical protein
MERYHLEDLAVDGRIILKCIFKKLKVEAWTVFSWFRTDIGGVGCERGKEPSGSIKSEEFID